MKKYQEYLPAQGMHDLAQTAFAPRPVMSESEQEYTAPVILRPGIGRSKSRHRAPIRKPSTSDFEQGYAANVAPRYLTHTRKTINAQNGSRIPIPAPISSAFESQRSSRRASPEKRAPLTSSSKEVRFSRPSSPHGGKSTSPGVKPTKSRIVSRTKDKPNPRPPPPSGGKSTLRRPPTGPGSRVSTMAKHYERLGRDAERSKSRYAVIRGKRARPVASARAKVEVLDSVKDAIADDSESSDSSSEADDEDEGNDEEHPGLPVIQTQSPTSELPSPEPLPSADSITETLPSTSPIPPETHEGETSSRLQPPGQIPMPASPFLSSVKSRQETVLTPPHSDIDMGSGMARDSLFFKALSGFWPQAARNSIEGDDPMSDPEHIFRDSSMVVRLDEPTSIIALALK